MIGRLEGRLHRLEPGKVLIEAGGVGYLVSTTLREFHDLDESQTVALWIHTQVRDDAIVLYGFPQREELEAFQKLIGVAGVGPKTALGVFSALSASELAETVRIGDLARLQKSPGVGRKTAERIVLELKDRLSGGGPEIDTRHSDAVSALVNLGYAQREAHRAVESVRREAQDGDLGEVLRLALRKLNR